MTDEEMMKQQQAEAEEGELEMSSKYNEAGLQIARLHEMWLDAEDQARTGKFTKWKFSLDTIWRELLADLLKLPNAKELMKEDEEYKKKIAFARTRTQIYATLDARHQALKIIQDSCGKGSIQVVKDDGLLED